MISDAEGDGGLSEPEEHEMLASSTSLQANRSLNVSIPLHPDASSSLRASIPLDASIPLRPSHSLHTSHPLNENSSLDESSSFDESSLLNQRIQFRPQFSSLPAALLERLIREFDVDQQQVEEETTEEPLERTFDLTLPARHSYFGNDFEEFRGRTILDEGIYMKLPLLAQKSIMLFPGQTLSMKLDSHSLDLKFFYQGNRTIGVVCFEYNRMVTAIGVTAEIYEMARVDGGYAVKAKGRQRFKILKPFMEGVDEISANVKILPEITLGPPFLEQRLASLDHLRIKATTEEEFKRQERIENRDAVLTPWPGWVYRQYDPQRLSLRIRRHLKYIRVDTNVPEDPTNLSFWVAQNLLLDDNARNVLLHYDCAISRLQMEIKYLANEKIFVCDNCETEIGKQSNMLTMSIDGPLGIYCNRAGILHDIVTLSHTQCLVLSSNTISSEFTWFQGYGWTAAMCQNCDSHIGWKFTAVGPNLKPKMFWALSRQNIISKDT
ncbi:E3 ubiquitin ligase component cereblon isoform X2 [Halictus rubicundus]|uniref:E3 ubiquitin ligase component cereblon isoform X2 n=1 Tax=Halictus rubicundus TaxID=77578 RepID=UPI00403677F2